MVDFSKTVCDFSLDIYRHFALKLLCASTQPAPA